MKKFWILLKRLLLMLLRRSLRFQNIGCGRLGVFVIRVYPQFVDKILIYIGTLGTPVVTYRSCKSFTCDIQLEIDKCISSFFNNTFYGIFLIFIIIVICIDFRFVFQIYLFGFEVVEYFLASSPRLVIL